MPLLSLPFDALLDVLRDLDIIDVIRTGMVSPQTVAVLHPALMIRSSRNVTDLQRPLQGHTSPLRLGRPARKVVSKTSGTQVCHASAHFPLRARVENFGHWSG